MDIDFDCNQHLGFRVALWSNFGGCVKIKIPNNFLEVGLYKVIQFNHIRNGKTCGMQIKRTIQSMSYEMSKYNCPTCKFHNKSLIQVEGFPNILFFGIYTMKMFYP